MEKKKRINKYTDSTGLKGFFAAGEIQTYDLQFKKR